MSDDLLPLIAAGDADAFGRFVAAAEPRLRASLLSLAGAVDIEAVVQEALLRVWQVAPRVVLDGRPESLMRLTIRIARNAALDELRRRRARPDLVSAFAQASEPERAVELATPDPMLRAAIASCREKLPGKPASALQARLDGAGTPDRDLAAGLGMKLNTFLQNVTRARALLTACLRKLGIDLELERA